MTRSIQYALTCLSIAMFSLVGLLASGCSMYSVLPNEDQPKTPMELIRWIQARVEYIDYDYINYWQSPRETLRYGQGDCEDFAILFMSMSHDLWGWEPELQLVKVDGGKYLHYWCEWEGVIYDACSGFILQNPGDFYTVICVTDYDNAMFTATAGYAKSVQNQ